MGEGTSSILEKAEKRFFAYFVAKDVSLIHTKVKIPLFCFIRLQSLEFDSQTAFLLIN